MVWIPDIGLIKLIYNEYIDSGVLMNELGLISTLDKVEWGIPISKIQSIWDKVAILYKEIIENHYYSDGNKRLGVLLAYIFLDKNGHEFLPKRDEIYDFTIEVAQGFKTYEEIKLWFKRNSIKK